MTRSWIVEHGSFGRMFDELFDELLLSRWRLRAHSGEATESQLLEHDDRYEARVPTADADPRSVEVRAGVHRLIITFKAGSGASLERVFTFSERIDPAGVKARWWQGVLTVVLPKRPRARGKVA